MHCGSYITHSLGTVSAVLTLFVVAVGAVGEENGGEAKTATSCRLTRIRAGETGDPRENPPTSAIVQHDSHLQKSRVTRPGIEPGSPWWEASRLTAHRTFKGFVRRQLMSLGSWIHDRRGQKAALHLRNSSSRYASTLRKSKYSFAPEENTQFSECSHTAKMNCEYEGLSFDLDDHRAVICSIADCFFPRMRPTDAGAIRSTLPRASRALSLLTARLLTDMQCSRLIASLRAGNTGWLSGVSWSGCRQLGARDARVRRLEGASRPFLKSDVIRSQRRAEVTSRTTPDYLFKFRACRPAFQHDSTPRKARWLVASSITIIMCEEPDWSRRNSDSSHHVESAVRFNHLITRHPLKAMCHNESLLRGFHIKGKIPRLIEILDKRFTDGEIDRGTYKMTGILMEKLQECSKNWTNSWKIIGKTARYIKILDKRFIGGKIDRKIDDKTGILIERLEDLSKDLCKDWRIDEKIAELFKILMEILWKDCDRMARSLPNWNCVACYSDCSRDNSGATKPAGTESEHSRGIIWIIAGHH
ncbi:hypothetical protein PR048_002479 [Dryococelus australis]|uniref:Uncharacterized protein n=1 Tax=Dryococelus australis TaxID=614101 RepID=A0ABQ9IKA1_9NEOP|nr:hypothetical protein PR048_002479 [Dryococelus australis]